MNTWLYVAIFAALFFSITAIVVAFVVAYEISRNPTTAGDAEQISFAAATLVEPMRIRLECIESELSSAKEKIGALEQHVRDLQDENERLSDWASRLAHQVQSLGHKPIEPRKRIVSARPTGMELTKTPRSDE